MQDINVLDQVIRDEYAIYNGDSCEVLAGVPDASIDLSVFSPLRLMATSVWKTSGEIRSRLFKSVDGFIMVK